MPLNFPKQVQIIKWQSTTLLIINSLSLMARR